MKRPSFGFAVGFAILALGIFTTQFLDAALQWLALRFPAADAGVSHYVLLIQSTLAPFLLLSAIFGSAFLLAIVDDHPRSTHRLRTSGHGQN